MYLRITSNGKELSLQIHDTHSGPAISWRAPSLGGSTNEIIRKLHYLPGKPSVKLKNDKTITVTFATAGQAQTTISQAHKFVGHHVKLD